MKIINVTKEGCFHFTSSVINYDECWIYVGSAYWIKGYPIVRRLYKNWIVSRFVWYILTGRDYWTREVHHTCRTRACVNPFHLEELTKRKHRRLHNATKKN